MDQVTLQASATTGASPSNDSLDTDLELRVLLARGRLLRPHSRRAGTRKSAVHTIFQHTHPTRGAARTVRVLALALVVVLLLPSLVAAQYESEGVTPFGPLAGG